MLHGKPNLQCDFKNHSTKLSPRTLHFFGDLNLERQLWVSSYWFSSSLPQKMAGESKPQLYFDFEITYYQNITYFSCNWHLSDSYKSKLTTLIFELQLNFFNSVIKDGWKQAWTWLLLRVRQCWNDFVKPTFLPKNEQTNLTLLKS